MAVDLDRVRKAITDTAHRSVEQRLILEWQWRGVLPELHPFRRLLWTALEAATEEQLSQAARGFADEVRSIRLFRTTWIGQQLADEGLLSARHIRRRIAASSVS